ncbi:Hypothetical predicted protein [Pelobates cultripes]|uniref:Uncharacterized protein n=1 Tax=Pelobates cultripes TaxID=61616 RepID=A0AAD1TIZ0_PELCU|nr:Hypothetical predicted protein [Pelobates cultripes]
MAEHPRGPPAETQPSTTLDSINAIFAAFWLPLENRLRGSPLPTQCPSSADGPEGISTGQTPTKDAQIRRDMHQQPPKPEAENPTNQQGATVTRIEENANRSHAKDHPKADPGLEW